MELNMRLVLKTQQKNTAEKNKINSLIFLKKDEIDFEMAYYFQPCAVCVPFTFSIIMSESQFASNSLFSKVGTNTIHRV